MGTDNAAIANVVVLLERKRGGREVARQSEKQVADA